MEYERLASCQRAVAQYLQSDLQPQSKHTENVGISTRTAEKSHGSRESDMRTHALHRITIAIVTALLPLLVAGCNNGGSATSSTSVATDPDPGRAVVELFVSVDSLFSYVEIRETAGVGITINWLRITASSNTLGGATATGEYLAGSLSRGWRVEGNGFYAVVFPSVDLPPDQQLVRAELNYTDDNGNQATVVYDPVKG